MAALGGDYRIPDGPTQTLPHPEGGEVVVKALYEPERGPVEGFCAAVLAWNTIAAECHPERLPLSGLLLVPPGFVDTPALKERRARLSSEYGIRMNCDIPEHLYEAMGFSPTRSTTVGVLKMVERVEGGMEAAKAALERAKAEVPARTTFGAGRFAPTGPDLAIIEPYDPAEKKTMMGLVGFNGAGCRQILGKHAQTAKSIVLRQETYFLLPEDAPERVAAEAQACHESGRWRGGARISDHPKCRSGVIVTYMDRYVVQTAVFGENVATGELEDEPVQVKTMLRFSPLYNDMLKFYPCLDVFDARPEFENGAGGSDFEPPTEVIDRMTKLGAAMQAKTEADAA